MAEKRQYRGGGNCSGKCGSYSRAVEMYEHREPTQKGNNNGYPEQEIR